MLGYNRTIARTNINVLINIWPGVEGGRKRRGIKGNLPNTFDDDCRCLVFDANGAHKDYIGAIYPASRGYIFAV